MIAKFTRGTDGRLGIRFEPQTFEEQLLLEIFTKHSEALGHDFRFSNWEHNNPGRPMRDGLTSCWGEVVAREHTTEALEVEAEPMRCVDCDAPLATAKDVACPCDNAPSAPVCASCAAVCWRDYNDGTCRRTAPIDWKARALAAEGKLQRIAAEQPGEPWRRE